VSERAPFLFARRACELSLVRVPVSGRVVSSFLVSLR
jgi:hypothetical protein